MPIYGLKWGNVPAALSPMSAQTSSTPRLAPVPEDEERRRRVEAVRKAVEAGEYHVDKFVIADRLIEQGVLEDDEV